MEQRTDAHQSVGSSGFNEGENPSSTIFDSPPAPAGAGWSGRYGFQGFAKNAHPWLSSSRSSRAEKQSLTSAAVSKIRRFTHTSLAIRRGARMWAPGEARKTGRPHRAAPTTLRTYDFRALGCALGA